MASRTGLTQLPTMTLHRRILTYATVGILALTFVFIPWKTYDMGYILSPFWLPIPYDEGGARLPHLLGAEWIVISVVHALLFRRLGRHDNAP